MSILRFGVIGIGYGQAVLVPAIRLDPRASVVALASNTLSKAQKVAAELNVPHAYGSWRDLLEAGELDAIAIAVPPQFQAEILIQALELGLAVFAEKPLAMNLADADRMIAAQKMYGAKCAIDFNFTGVKAFNIAREQLLLGVIGPLRHLVVNWQVESYSNRNRLTNWKTGSATGGGTLFNFVSHTLHYLEWMSGDEIKNLSARLWGIPGDTRLGDTSVAIQLEFASGAAGMLAVSAAANHGTGHEVAFYGENGAVILRNSSSDYMRGFDLLIARRDHSAQEIVSIDSYDENDSRVLPTAYLISQFIDSISSGEIVEFDLFAGRRVQALIEAAMASDRSRCWVSV